MDERKCLPLQFLKGMPASHRWFYETPEQRSILGHCASVIMRLLMRAVLDVCVMSVCMKSWGSIGATEQHGLLAAHAAVKDFFS